MYPRDAQGQCTACTDPLNALGLACGHAQTMHTHTKMIENPSHPKGTHILTRSSHTPLPASPHIYISVPPPFDQVRMRRLPSFEHVGASADSVRSHLISRLAADSVRSHLISRLTRFGRYTLRGYGVSASRSCKKAWRSGRSRGTFDAL